MQLTKGAIGNLINRYKAVLKKCHLLNVFGSLAVAGMLVMGGAGVAGANEGSLPEKLEESKVLESQDPAYFTKPGSQVIDLNGKKISTNASGSLGGGAYGQDALVIVKYGSDLTINDSIGGGGITTETLMGGIKITETGGAANGQKASLTVNGGKVQGANYGIAGNGTRHNTEITVNGGEISGGTSGIYHPQEGTLTVTGGTISGGDTGIELRSGTINVSGGTIVSKAESFSGSANGSGTTIKGAALAISQHTTNKEIVVNISGGTFTGYYALFEKDMQDEQPDNINMNVTGGEFKGKIYSENCSGFITGGKFSDPTALHYLGDGANIQIALTGNYSGEEGGLNKKPFEIGSNRTVDMNLGGYTFEMTEKGNTSAGNISIANGTLKLTKDLRVTGGSMTIADEGSMTIADEGSMTIDDGGSATFENDSLLAVNGNNLTDSNAAITVRDGQLVVYDKARLRIDNAKSGQTVNIVDGSSVTWKEIEAGTDLLTAKMEGGKVTFNRDKDASEVFTGVDGNTAAMLNTLIDKGLNNVDSDQMGVRFLSRATDNHFLGADKDAAAATIESAARIAFAGAVPQMTKMASDAGTNAVVNRLGFANPADGAQAMDAEGKIVDRNTTGFALWIAPLWQSQHGWGMEAGNLDYGFNGNLGGVSLGADYTFENAIRAGITFNIGGGYAESSGGDLNSTENRMSFWGLGAYAGWNYENFGLMADVSYTSTWNDLKQDVDGRMGMGDLEADVQASAISAGLRAEYKLETSVLDVIPHIGVRYMSLNTWGFDAESNGGTVLEGDGFHQDIWTFPVGVTFTKDFTLDSGWFFKPSVDFSVIPAAGDIKAKSDVAFTGLPGTYEVETQMMDYLTWQGGVGLELANDTMSFGVNYTLQAGQNSTGHGLFGSFRYEF